MKLIRLFLVLLIFTPTITRANPPIEHQRINIRVYNEEVPRGGIIFHRFTDPDNEPNPCFPYGCGGISGPFTNPNPRKENEKPACYYDSTGVLFYERLGKSCPYIRRFDSYDMRVEKRRQEWLKSHSVE